MNVKTALLCQPLPIYHSAQSGLKTQHEQQEEKHLCWIQTWDQGQGDHIILHSHPLVFIQTICHAFKYFCTVECLVYFG